jgi:hypothetical protein
MSGGRKRLGRISRRQQNAQVSHLVDHTTEDTASGAIRSVQTAELTLPHEELETLWTPMYLERLARTFWRFHTRVTLGLVRMIYSDTERSLVLLVRPLKLLTFKTPEYELDAEHGLVRWQIEGGLLVAKRGRGADGHLQIDVHRLPETTTGEARLQVEVEISNYHPAIASGISRRVYKATQSRIHVLFALRFLRSLARLEFAESKVGRFTR